MMQTDHLYICNILYLLVLATVRWYENCGSHKSKQEQLKQAHAAQVRALQDEHRRQQEELLQVRQWDGLLVIMGEEADFIKIADLQKKKKNRELYEAKK